MEKLNLRISIVDTENLHIGAFEVLAYYNHPDSAFGKVDLCISDYNLGSYFTWLNGYTQSPSISDQTDIESFVFDYISKFFPKIEGQGYRAVSEFSDLVIKSNWRL